MLCGFTPNSYNCRIPHAAPEVLWRLWLQAFSPISDLTDSVRIGEQNEGRKSDVDAVGIKLQQREISVWYKDIKENPAL